MMETPSRREVPVVKDKRAGTSHRMKTLQWKLIRVNDFIHHISTVNNAQIIKRNVSVSLHSISAIRWHYCTSWHWLIFSPRRKFGIPLGVSFFVSSFSLLRVASIWDAWSARVLLIVARGPICAIFISLFFDFSIWFVVASMSPKKDIGTLSSKSNSNKVLADVKRYRDNLTRRREGGNNIFWITITCLWSNANTTVASPCHRQLSLAALCIRSFVRSLARRYEFRWDSLSPPLHLCEPCKSEYVMCVVSLRVLLDIICK